MKDVNQVVDNTLDSLNKARTARPVAGASRKGNNPVLFLIGKPTMRTGTLGNGKMCIRDRPKYPHPAF